MKHSYNCIELIKRFEGFSDKPYLCPAGVPTIGYGSTRYCNGIPVTMNDPPISTVGAHLIINCVLTKEYEPAITRYVLADITQNQFDALVSFAYNVGVQNLKKSSLLRFVNANKKLEAAEEFLKWTYCDGVILQGLVARRKCERNLFLS